MGEDKVKYKYFSGIVYNVQIKEKQIIERTYQDFLNFKEYIILKHRERSLIAPYLPKSERKF